MSISLRVLEEAQADEHLVQFYEADEGMLVSNVSRYLCEGLNREAGLLIVATPEHTESFLHGLEREGCEVAAATAAGKLTCLGANETLARFLVDGYPNAARFENVVGTLVREARLRAPNGLRVYGEMVGELWKARQYPAAIRLEQLWHKLLREVDFNLFCAYPIDVFDDHFQPGVVDALLCAHTHLLPLGNNGDLHTALRRAMTEILGTKVRELRPFEKQHQRTGWAQMPEGESLILWLRSNAPDRAHEIVRLAKAYYQKLTNPPADPVALHSFV